MLCLPFLLAGCADLSLVEEDGAVGGITPEAIVEKFVSDLNDALGDPNLAVPEVERAWSERLANHFAPGERVDQRAALRTMLARFAGSLSQLEPGERLLLDLSYRDVEVISRQENRAIVALNDGVLSLRWFGADGNLIRQRSRNLLELLDIQGGGLPVIRVNGRWFLTEG